MILAPSKNRYVSMSCPMRRLDSALLSLPMVVVLALLFVLTGTGEFAMAQDVVGRISGTVTDSQGAVVPDAHVTITNEATGISRPPISTNGAGFYVADALPVGTYSVTVEKNGFKKTTMTGNSLTAGGRLGTRLPSAMPGIISCGNSFSMRTPPTPRA